MFEPVIEAWLRYSVLLDATDPPEGNRAEGNRAEGNRAGLTAEIHTRFGQLDMILARIVETMDVSSQSGDDAAHKRFLEAWDWVSIHSDSFYFFGWRVLDLLNGEAGKLFPYLDRIEPADFLAVRDSMLDHPEQQSHYYRHAMELRDEAEEKISRAVTLLEGQA
ncbi:hypothetical protein ACIHCQ_28495 [Streptomyces sp. NPDC052236]|uniref:hypothetical protein n=1 Tax=Streptomyces sp. NPDC052236 TaxID=3365686 RepID=UPI0037D94FE1